MKKAITVHIYHSQYSWETTPRFQVYSVKMDDCEHMTYMNSQEVEISVPDDYDPRPAQIAALEKQKVKVMADFQKTVNQINERISKLQALEYTA